MVKYYNPLNGTKVMKSAARMGGRFYILAICFAVVSSRKS